MTIMFGAENADISARRFEPSDKPINLSETQLPLIQTNHSISKTYLMKDILKEFDEQNVASPGDDQKFVNDETRRQMISKEDQKNNYEDGPSSLKKAESKR